MLELGDGSAIERGRSDDMIAGPQQRKQCSGLGGEPACECNRTRAAIEVGDTFLECCNRGIHDPRIGIAVLLEVEIGGSRLRVFENVARRLVDRKRARPSRRIRATARVHGAGRESEFPI